jgi:hypothetical protein
MILQRDRVHRLAHVPGKKNGAGGIGRYFDSALQQGTADQADKPRQERQPR